MSTVTATPPSPSQRRVLDALADARLRALPQDALLAEAARLTADVEMAALLRGDFAPLWSAVTEFAANGYLSAEDDEQVRLRLRRCRERVRKALALPPGS